jgi:hypothetical protein
VRGRRGCLAVLCPPARRAEVRERLERAGGVVLDARPTAEPLSVRMDGAAPKC